MTAEPREFRQVGEDTYELTMPAFGVRLRIDRLYRDRDQQLHGELAVACDLAGAHLIDGHLSVATLNLSSASARHSRAKLLAERSEAPELDWFGLIEELSVRTITAERIGAPGRYLADFENDRDDPSAEWLVNGWPWLREHTMITFGDGGALKSYLALYGLGCLAQQGIAVGYCDWELSGRMHKYRLGQLFGDVQPPILYLRCDKPLVAEADRIQRESRRHGLEYLVMDSVGFGTPGPPEAAEHAISYCRALRQIGLGANLLAHVNRSENGDQKPFGSSFWHNSARSTWFVKRTSADGLRVNVALVNRKSNLSRLHPAIGFQFDFSDSRRVPVNRIDPSDVEELAAQLPLWQRIKSSVTQSPCTLAQLAEALGASVDTVDRTVRRHRDLFTRTSGRDGISRITLVERRDIA